jgi:hypothetical protein
MDESREGETRMIQSREKKIEPRKREDIYTYKYI